MKKMARAILMMLALLCACVQAVAADNGQDSGDLSAQYQYMTWVDHDEYAMVVPGDFVVDSKGTLYIVNQFFDRVQVYQGGKYRYSIRLKKSGGGTCYLKLDGDDNLYISLVRGNYGLKYHGQTLLEVVDDYQKAGDYPQYFSACGYEYTDVKGNVYERHNPVWDTCVTRITPDGRQVKIYQMPVHLWLMKAGVYMGICLWFVIGSTFAILSSIKKWQSEQH